MSRRSQRRGPRDPRGPRPGPLGNPGDLALIPEGQDRDIEEPVSGARVPFCLPGYPQRPRAEIYLLQAGRRPRRVELWRLLFSHAPFSALTLEGCLRTHPPKVTSECTRPGFVRDGELSLVEFGMSYQAPGSSGYPGFDPGSDQKSMLFSHRFFKGFSTCSMRFSKLIFRCLV